MIIASHIHVFWFKTKTRKALIPITGHVPTQVEPEEIREGAS